MDKIKVFVGSSVGGLSHARAVKQNLDYDAWVRLWNQGIFRTGSYPLDDLIAALDDADFGAFIFLPEDILILNRQNQSVETKAVRDNVIFELGMFAGRLGRDRIFMIKPRGKELHLPSDLSGVNLSDFTDDPNLLSALGTAADEILARIRKLGPKAASRESQAPATPGYDRVLALANATASSGALLHGRKYSRSDVILPSGDVESSERYESMEAIGDPVDKVPAGPPSLDLSRSPKDNRSPGRGRRKNPTRKAAKAWPFLRRHWSRDVPSRTSASGIPSTRSLLPSANDWT